MYLGLFYLVAFCTLLVSHRKYMSPTFLSQMDLENSNLEAGLSTHTYMNLCKPKCMHACQCCDFHDCLVSGYQPPLPRHSCVSLSRFCCRFQESGCLHSK